MATIDTIIGNVKENLGNRSSGVIGGTPVDTVVLKAVNKGFKNIIKVANPTHYNRLAELSLVAGTAEYAEPVVDLDGNTIRIKQLGNVRLNLTGETAVYHTTQITIDQYLSAKVPSTNETGVPTLYCYHNRKFLFQRYPDSAYNFTMAVKIMPTDFTMGDINTVLPLDEMWEEVIEAYATHYCFSKLQLTKNATYWHSVFSKAKKTCKSTIYKQPGLKQPNSPYLSAADPLTDPFTRRFN